MQKFISDVLPWTSTRGNTSVGQPEKTYKNQLWGKLDVLRQPAMKDGQEERVARDTQGKPCYLRDSMMILMLHC